MTHNPVFPAYSGYKFGYRRHGRFWVGVVKSEDGRTVVAECGHAHHNRDVTSQQRGRSATDCARSLVTQAFALERTAWHREGLRDIFGGGVPA